MLHSWLLLLFFFLNFFFSRKGQSTFICRGFLHLKHIKLGAFLLLISPLLPFLFLFKKCLNFLLSRTISSSSSSSSLCVIALKAMSFFLLLGFHISSSIVLRQPSMWSRGKVFQNLSILYASDFWLRLRRWFKNYIKLTVSICFRKDFRLLTIIVNRENIL